MSNRIFENTFLHKCTAHKQEMATLISLNNDWSIINIIYNRIDLTCQLCKEETNDIARKYPFINATISKSSNCGYTEWKRKLTKYKGKYYLIRVYKCVNLTHFKIETTLIWEKIRIDDALDTFSLQKKLLKKLESSIIPLYMHFDLNITPLSKLNIPFL